MWWKEYYITFWKWAKNQMLFNEIISKKNLWLIYLGELQLKLKKKEDEKDKCLGLGRSLAWCIK